MQKITPETWGHKIGDYVDVIERHGQVIFSGRIITVNCDGDDSELLVVGVASEIEFKLFPHTQVISRGAKADGFAIWFEKSKDYCGFIYTQSIYPRPVAEALVNSLNSSSDFDLRFRSIWMPSYMALVDTINTREDLATITQFELPVSSLLYKFINGDRDGSEFSSFAIDKNTGFLMLEPNWDLKMTYSTMFIRKNLIFKVSAV